MSEKYVWFLYMQILRGIVGTIEYTKHTVKNHAMFLF